VTGVYELAGAGWDPVPVEDTAEACRLCGHELALHDVGSGCDECGCVYGIDGWALEDVGGRR